MTYVYIFLGVLAVLFVGAMFVVKPRNEKGGILVKKPLLDELVIPPVDDDDDRAATNPQMESMERTFGAKFRRQISFDQASLILDARQYAIGMLSFFERSGHPIDEATGIPAIIHFIMKDPELRDDISEWGRERFKRGHGKAIPLLKPDQNFHKVYKFISELSGETPKIQ
ncbi:hypothetical protein [Thalassospira sp.]|uniref:hypothetical protein n=1 Tax=Thalassospira sp. TaxID=1912094 RepID=UPI003AA865D2